MAHIQANHGGRDETYKQVRTLAGWGVLKDLVHEYIQNCPICVKARTSKAAHSKRSTAKKASTRLSTTAATKTSMDSRIESGSPLRLDTSALPEASSPESIFCPEKCLHPLVQASSNIMGGGQHPESVIKIYQGQSGGSEAFNNDLALPSRRDGAGSLATPPMSSPEDASKNVQQQSLPGYGNSFHQDPLTAPSVGIKQGNFNLSTDNAMYGTTTTTQPMTNNDWARVDDSMPSFDPTMVEPSWMEAGYYMNNPQPQQLQQLQYQQQQQLEPSQASQPTYQSFGPIQTIDAGLEDFLMADATGKFELGDHIDESPKTSGFIFNNKFMSVS
jgi:hypothetical protein